MITVTKEQERKTLEIERSMFGCTLAEFKGSTLFTDWNDPVDLNSLAQAILSDAQEVLTANCPGAAELARQFMNRAKFVISESTVAQRKREGKGA